MRPTDIITKACLLVLNHPELWVFGLFLSGGFNFNLLYFFSFSAFGSPVSLFARLSDFAAQQPPTWGLSLITVCIIVVGLVLSNWLKIIFICNLRYLLPEASIVITPRQKQEEDSLTFWQRQLRWARPKQSQLVAVTAMSAITIFSTSLVSATLFGPILFWVRGSEYQTALSILAACLFFGVVFFFSCLNIFTSFAIIIYNKSLSQGLALAFDLVSLKFHALLRFAAVLLVMYALGLAMAMWGMILFQRFLDPLFFAVLKFDWLPIIGLVQAYSLLSALVLWGWVGILNAGFNASLFIFFIRAMNYKQSDESIVGVAPGPLPEPLAQVRRHGQIPHPVVK